MMNKELCKYHQKKGTWREIYCKLCRSKKAYCGQYEYEEDKHTAEDLRPAHPDNR